MAEAIVYCVADIIDYYMAEAIKHCMAEHCMAEA
jgi:hypothetical protein